jgi:hypothetical protein
MGEFSMALGGLWVYIVVLKDINVKSAIQTMEDGDEDET